jgi:DNA-binding CsgD family transcriptional regulator
MREDSDSDWVDRLLDDMIYTQKTEMSKQEIRVLLAAAYGQTIDSTADMLGTSHDTVATQRKIILRKLRAKSMAQAVANAMRQGIIR